VRDKEEYTGYAPDGRPAPEGEGIPTAPGYYWATARAYGWRALVLLRRNGRGHMRVYPPAISSSMGLEEFRNYNGPVTEPAAPEASGG